MIDDAPTGQPVVQGQNESPLRVVGNQLPAEHIDGARWPRSTRLAVELPRLLSALSARLGQVVMVGYRRNDGLTHRQLSISQAIGSGYWA